ncbi:MAG: hypothetical protein B7Z26_05020 [Asticcacaulis sp. 32-58-5]|nr:MAG: hypothetical protein B7Z26_05020 [Asticcacaulis sp. 32-58-5]
MEALMRLEPSSYFCICWKVTPSASATAVANDEGHFWVVSARVSGSAVTGLGTLLSGAYVGMDAGEWGGGLHRIDRSTSEVITIGPKNGKCGDVLYPECDAVTGVAPIPWKPDCVAVTTGKAHLSTMRGALIEVCGTEVRVMLQKEYQPAPPIKPDAQYPVGHVPFLGVYTKGDVLTALTASHAYEFRDGNLTDERPLPPREILGGVSVSFGDADIVRVQPYVQTATSRAYGYPLLIVK